MPNTNSWRAVGIFYIQLRLTSRLTVIHCHCDQTICKYNVRLFLPESQCKILRGNSRYPPFATLTRRQVQKYTYFLCVFRGIVAFGFIFNDVKAEAAKEDTTEVNSVLASSPSLDRNLLTRASKKVTITINYPRGR